MKEILFRSRSWVDDVGGGWDFVKATEDQDQELIQAGTEKEIEFIASNLRTEIFFKFIYSINNALRTSVGLSVCHFLWCVCVSLCPSLYSF